jgi:hypothetical protein
MTQKQAIVRMLLALLAFSLMILGRLLRFPSTPWIAALILIGAWLWTGWALRVEAD